MELGKIIGTVIATQKHHSLVGTRLCVVQPLDNDMKEVDIPVVAVDVESKAGYGEIVFTVTGGDASVVSKHGEMPVDVAIVGIVHSLSVSDKE
ncbi:TPA: ethanolamine utilization protein EutN [bacterium]|jgi:ethanolamine utilization protein EutN|nr:ethanolamine utilization protein EutN [bacterium]